MNSSQSTQTIATEVHRDRIAQALMQVESEGRRFNGGDIEGRQELIASTRALLNSLQTPVESLLWHIWALPTRSVAARIAVDLKIFETACGEGGGPKTAEQLAAVTDAAPMLVSRIARTCASMNMLDEQGPSLYIPNDLTRLLAQPEYAAGIVFCFDAPNLVFAKLPAYLRDTGFKNPLDPLNGAFQYATNHIGHAFSSLAAQPELF